MPDTPTRPVRTVAVSVYPSFIEEVDAFAARYNLPRSRAIEFLGRKGLDLVKSQEGQ